MNERTSLVQAARDVLAQEPVLSPPSDAETAAIVAAMAKEIERTRQRRFAWRGAAAFAAAAAVIVGFVALRPKHVESVAAPGAPGGLATGHHLVVPAGGQSELALPSGSRIEAFEQTDLVISSLGATQAFALGAGRASFHVQKLAKSERFVVTTPDAEVEVRGTVFTVTVLEGEPVCGSHTRVDVVEGVVEVRHGGATESLTPGMHFPVCAPPAASSAPTTVTSAPAVAVPATPSANSTISAQNQLFATGIDARKHGDKAAALAAFDTYLAKYPRGFLAESAEVERMRLLSGAQRTAAAKAYLARHPQGFARAEAKAIVDASP